mgnify:CR=1 FL=1
MRESATVRPRPTSLLPTSEQSSKPAVKPRPKTIISPTGSLTKPPIAAKPSLPTKPTIIKPKPALSKTPSSETPSVSTNGINSQDIYAVVNKSRPSSVKQTNQRSVVGDTFTKELTQNAEVNNDLSQASTADQTNSDDDISPMECPEVPPKLPPPSRPAHSPTKPTVEAHESSPKPGNVSRNRPKSMKITEDGVHGQVANELASILGRPRSSSKGLVSPTNYSAGVDENSQPLQTLNDAAG